MTQPNWIDLWLLNELVLDHCKVSQLIWHPNEKSHWAGYWSFQTEPFLSASIDIRMEALNKSVSEGLIEVYRRSWLAEQRFGAYHDRAVPCQCRTGDTLEDYEAALTQKGHEKWETEFEPDWQRFWMQWGSDKGESTHQKAISLLYASDQILDDLIQWFPSLWHCSSVGMKRLDSFTIQQHQATFWKTLPWVKVTKWQVQSNLLALNDLIQAEIPAGLADNHPIRAAGRERVRQFMKAEGEEAEKAARILLRLSKRWD